MLYGYYNNATYVRLDQAGIRSSLDGRLSEQWQDFGSPKNDGQQIEQMKLVLTHRDR